MNLLKKELSFKTQLFMAFSLISLALSLFYYQRNLSLQNNILETSFIKNNKLIFKTVKLGLEVGLKSDNFQAIGDVFKYAKSEKDLDWIIITDGENDVFANYPEDLNVEEAWKETSKITFLPTDSQNYTESGKYATPVAKGNLFISFKTDSYQKVKSQLKRESLILTGSILVLSLLVSFLISKFIMNSLSILQKTIETITLGNFNEKIDSWSRTKEVQKLKTSFNAMMNEINTERQKSESLLLNILPPKIAQRLKNSERNIALSNPKAAILFADLVGYTSFSKDKSPEEVVSLLNEIFSRFDEKTSLLNLEKIKTIGDSYMVAGGLFTEEDEAKEVLELAKGLNDILIEINEEFKTEFKVRIGIHSGPIVAGVIGKIKFSFDIWGNTVNQASRLESMGIPGRIHISKECYDSLAEKGVNVKNFEPNSFKAKGLGELSSFLL